MALTDEDKKWILEQLREQLTERLAEQRTQLEERIERVETSLLTEFHKWASPVEARQRSHSAALRAFDEELESLSERVQKIEQKR